MSIEQSQHVSPVYIYCDEKKMSTKQISKVLPESNNFDFGGDFARLLNGFLCNSVRLVGRVQRFISRVFYSHRFRHLAETHETNSMNELAA